MKKERNYVLTEAREKLNLTQTEFAANIGTVVSTYSDIESLRYIPSKKVQRKISEFLIDNKIYLLEEDLFSKKLYNKTKPNIQFISLDEIGDNEIPYEGNRYLKEINKEHKKYGIGRVLRKLSDRERNILISYTGIGGKKPKTLEEISEDFGGKPTGSRIGQIKDRAVKKCKSNVREYHSDKTAVKYYLVN